MQTSRQSPAHEPAAAGPHGGHHTLRPIAARSELALFAPLGSNYTALWSPVYQRQALSLHRMHGQRAPWFGQEFKLDDRGRTWSRTFAAVTDDFGNLVEVPA